MRLRPALLLACLFAASAPSIAGQLASMIGDLRTTAVGGSSSPRFLGFASDTAYFSAEAPGIGRELWRSDGTSEGTRLVADRCFGECASHYTALAQSEERLFLAASPNDYGGYVTELLVATGNPSEVQSILASSATVSLSSLSSEGSTALLGGELVFWTVDNFQTAELYSARGPGADLTLLARFENTNGLGPLQRSGPLVYFWNDAYEALPELWTTDGTVSGTRRVAVLDIQGAAEVEVAMGTQSLVFAAYDQNGSELWISDGSQQGTRRLSNFADAAAYIWTAAASANRAYFFVEDVTFGQELWTTNGTAEGTHAITSFGFHQPFGAEYLPDQLIVAGDRAYFFATNGIDPMQLWVTTTEGSSAAPLTTVCADSDCFYDRRILSIGTQVFFESEDPDHGFEIWTTDGTPSGTRILEDACPGVCGGFGAVLASSGGRLVYSASQGSGNPTTIFVASAPWGASTSIFDPVRGAPTLDYYERGPALDSGEVLYFAAGDSLGGTEPWVSRGSPSTSLQLADIWGPDESSSRPRGFTASGGTVAFKAYDADYSYNGSIWLTEGSAASTRRAALPTHLCPDSNMPIVALVDRFLTPDCWGELLVIDPESSAVSAIPTGNCEYTAALGVLDGTAAAALWCGGETQVWRSDGTEAGTAPTLTLPDGFGVFSNFKAVGDHLLVVGGTDAARLYSLPASMSALVPLTGANDYFDSLIAPENESLAFFDLGTRIWRTDGTTGGTYAVGPEHDYLRLKAAVRSPTGYDLLVRTEANFYEVWSTDGTAPGTQFRTTLGPYYDSNQPLALARAGDFLYFTLYSFETGSTLWTLPDGSTEPHALHSVASESSPIARSLGYSGDRLYFSGCDASHGCELWTSDGTEAGTRLLHDIAPGPSSSNPIEFFAAGSLLYFTADDGQHGYELWALPLDAGPACRANELTLCLEGGRFQVSARWTDFSRRSGDAAAVPITGDTGYFWFFDEDNVELILKLIDGTGFNGHHWVYYGALSNVEYTFTVTDSETGAAKRYFNPATRFASSGDITAFGPQGAHALGGPAESMTHAGAPPFLSLGAFSAQGLQGACVPTATRFCILDNRFAVTATWRDFHGNSGTANAGTLTDDTGYLWFFDEANVEVVLKMVDAGTFNGHFWVYYGALSNVEYTLTVTDTVAGGPPKVYRNALGQFGSFGDIQAFPAP